jgi:hypothetical protein
VSHTIKAAMARGELTEEEAFFVLRFAGHYGYETAIKRLEGRSLLSRARKWLVWFGGWEVGELCQWDLGWPAWRFDRGVTPISFFGHRLTFFRGWFDVKIFGKNYTYIYGAGWKK